MNHGILKLIELVALKFAAREREQSIFLNILSKVQSPPKLNLLKQLNIFV